MFDDVLTAQIRAPSTASRTPPTTSSSTASRTAPALKPKLGDSTTPPPRPLPNPASILAPDDAERPGRPLTRNLPSVGLWPHDLATNVAASLRRPSPTTLDAKGPVSVIIATVVRPVPLAHDPATKVAP